MAVNFVTYAERSVGPSARPTNAAKFSSRNGLKLVTAYRSAAARTGPALHMCGHSTECKHWTELPNYTDYSHYDRKVSSIHTVQYTCLPTFYNLRFRGTKGRQGSASLISLLVAMEAKHYVGTTGKAYMHVCTVCSKQGTVLQRMWAPQVRTTYRVGQKSLGALWPAVARNIYIGPLQFFDGPRCINTWKIRFCCQNFHNLHISI